MVWIQKEKRIVTNGGIFGPKLSGKTTLARQLSRDMWTREKVRSLVFDPNNDDWINEKQCWTTADDKTFWDACWKVKNCVIVVEDSAATIRRDRTLVPVFTRMRHCNHRLLVIGHSGMDLLPVMRQQLDTLYLFRQPDSACKVWAETFTQDGLLEAKNLGQFEFLYTVSYGAPKKYRLKL
jgi:hypothetical protein